MLRHACSAVRVWKHRFIKGIAQESYVAVCVAGWMLVVLRYCRLYLAGCVCRDIRCRLYPESSGW